MATNDSSYTAHLAVFLPIRVRGVEQAFALRALQAAAEAGYSVVVVDTTDAKSRFSADQPHPLFFEALSRSGVRLAQPQEVATVEVAVAFRPSAGKAYEALGVTVAADHAILVSDTYFVDPEMTSAEDVESLISGFEAATHVKAAKLGALIRDHAEVLEQFGRSVLPGEWNFGVPEAQVKQPRAAAVDEEGVRIGRHIAAVEPQWPGDEAVVRRSLPTTSDWAVRIYGQHGRLLKIMGRTPENWQLNQVVGNDGLSNIDFWVPVSEVEVTSRVDVAIEEAIASGAVVILPSSLPRLWGDAALYS